MAPFWTDERDKTLLLLMLGPDRTISRAQAAEIAQTMKAPSSGDTIRYVFLGETENGTLFFARTACFRLVLTFVSLFFLQILRDHINPSVRQLSHPSSVTMPLFVWDDVRDRRFLLHLLDTSTSFPQARFAEIAQEMGAPPSGDTCRSVLD